jgi:hypothetical protein
MYTRIALSSVAVVLDDLCADVAICKFSIIFDNTTAFTVDFEGKKCNGVKREDVVK